MSQTPEVSVVIPVFNEESAIAADLTTIFRTLSACGKPFEVLVVDDGSTDHTADIIRGFPQVRLIQHSHNRGTGAARTTGMKAAQGQAVVMSDGDGTYPNQDIPRLLDALEHADMVIGARTREAGTWPMLRTPAKTFIRKLASYMTGTHIPDLNSGFRAVRREVGLRYLPILPNTHSWVSTITIAMLSDGYEVRFIPIDYYARTGTSSFHPLRDTYNYLSLVFRTILYFEPLKVFLPSVAVLGGVGMIKMVYDIFAYQFHFAPSTVLLCITTINLLAIGLLADLVVRRTKQ